MLFRTELHPKKPRFQISHSDKILSFGSCFADCMGERFEHFQFDIQSNPFGVLYNPLSIFGNSENALKFNELNFINIIESRETFFNYQFHSQISGTSAEELVEKTKQINRSVSERLSSTDYLFITLGTAFVYYLKGTTISVANCHRKPADYFDKKMLSVEEIVSSFKQFYKQLNLQNPNCKILITVSPVRHTKDTLELNAVSKAVLRLACHQITELESDNVAYFPAYEIMMDDLRDYRFYKEDLIHPNQQAETYIWEKFAETYFSAETQNLNKEIGEIQTALNHRAFNKDGQDHLSFLKKIEEKITQVSDKISVFRLLEKMALKLKV